MTREERDAIRARCEAATEGPWKVGDGSRETRYQGWDRVFSKDRCIASRAVYNYHNPDSFDKQTQRDMCFIANARQDIPALLDDLDEVEGHAERVCDYIEFCEGDPHDDDHCSWYCKCSECGNIEYSEPRYCPGCGAKINKEVE